MLLLLGLQHLLHRIDSRREDAGKQPLIPLHSTAKHRWKGAILMISICLVLSDFVYLLALSYPDSLIAVVSTVRRGGCIIAFAYGAIVLHDKNIRKKAICLIGVLLGMIFLLLGTL